jgi:hypothetical protein
MGRIAFQAVWFNRSVLAGRRCAHPELPRRWISRPLPCIMDLCPAARSTPANIQMHKKRPIAATIGRSIIGIIVVSRARESARLCSIAIPAKHRSTRLRLERHRCRLAAIRTDRLVELALRSRSVKIAIAVEVAGAAATTASASATTTTMSATAAAALRRAGLAFFATVSAALWRMFETAFRVALLILCRVHELLPTVQTLNHHVFVHLPRTSRCEIGGRVRASQRYGFLRDCDLLRIKGMHEGGRILMGGLASLVAMTLWAQSTSRLIARHDAGSLSESMRSEFHRVK